jgi:hypothetical protein
MAKQDDTVWFRREQEERARKAMAHPNVLGAGAEKREELPAKEKVGVVMKEFKHSGSGGIVKKRSQAIAVALSEAGMSKNKGKGKKK